jgi:hypothetical protein
MKPSEREIKAVGVMIGIHCHGRHGVTKGLCGDCRDLAAYAGQKVRACPFGEGKPVCSQCRIHCYKPLMRSRIREVMRFSGPRMILRHPLLAIRHLLLTQRTSG